MATLTKVPEFFRPRIFDSTFAIALGKIFASHIALKNVLLPKSYNRKRQRLDPSISTNSVLGNIVIISYISPEECIFKCLLLNSISLREVTRTLSSI